MPSHTHSHTSHKPTPCQTTRIPCHTNTFGHARRPCNNACKCASETETDFVLQGSQANSGASRGLQVGFCASVTHATGPPLALGIRTEICPSDGPGVPGPRRRPWHLGRGGYCQASLCGLPGCGWAQRAPTTFTPRNHRPLGGWHRRRR